MRIGGLASGMDTDAMVKQLMAAESVKLDRVQADKQILEWKKESLNSLNKDFANFILDGKKFLEYNSSGRPGKLDWIKKATSSDEKIGTATAGNGAFGGNHKLEVIELAKGVSGVSSGIVKESDWTKKAFEFEVNGKKVSVSDTDSIATIARKINGSGAGVQASYDASLGKFFIRTSSEGTNAKIEITSENNSTELTNFLDTIGVEMNEYGEDGSVLSGIGTDANKLKIDDKFVGTAGKVKYNDISATQATGVSGTSESTLSKDANIAVLGSFDFMINGKEIHVTKDETLESIIPKLNEDGTGIKAILNDDGKFHIESIGVGKDSKIEFTTVKNVGDVEIPANMDGLQTFLNTLSVKMDTHDDKDLTVGAKFEGEDEGPLTINSNQFTFGGVNFDVKAVGTFNVTVSNNTDDIVEKVKTFVNNYNKMLENTTKLLNEKKNRSFKPLTEEQKEAMSEKEVELWEAKAKAGVIRGDSDVERMLSSMRSDLYKNVEGVSGVFKHITEIGITTQGYKAGSVGGMLQIDEDKLRDAIARDADGVMEMLFKEDPVNAIADEDRLAEADRKNGTKTLEEKRANSGLFTRIFDNLTVGMKSIIAKSGPGEDSDLFRKVRTTIMGDFVTSGGRYSGKGGVSDIDNDMSSFNKKIDNLRTYLARKESMYYARFTAMEKAMQKSASQSGWLMQQMQ